MTKKRTASVETIHYGEAYLQKQLNLYTQSRDPFASEMTPGIFPTFGAMVKWSIMPKGQEPSRVIMTAAQATHIANVCERRLHDLHKDQPEFNDALKIGELIMALRQCSKDIETGKDLGIPATVLEMADEASRMDNWPAPRNRYLP